MVYIRECLSDKSLVNVDTRAAISELFIALAKTAYNYG